MPGALPHDSPAPGHARRPARATRGLCLLLAAVLAFQWAYLGSQPFAAGLVPEPWDKLAHALVFGAFTALLWIGTGGRFPLTVVAILVAAGAADELHQAGLPGRTADAVDFLVDVCAGAASIALISLYRRERRRAAHAMQQQLRGWTSSLPKG